jgi:hypothetical protein
MTARAILFLDVDGVLIPYGGDERVPDSASVARSGPETDDERHLRRIDPTLGARLLALGCDLVWATGWEDRANEVVAPLVGLPALPVLNWELTDMVSSWLHWKTATIVAFAAGRPMVWLDDELTGRDQEWVAMAHPARALLHRVDPRTGLTEADLDAVRGWLSSVE